MCGAQGASTVTPLANGPKVRFAREAQETKSDDLIVYAHPKVDAFQKAPATPVPFVFAAFIVLIYASSLCPVCVSSY